MTDFLCGNLYKICITYEFTQIQSANCACIAFSVLNSCKSRGEERSTKPDQSRKQLATCFLTEGGIVELRCCSSDHITSPVRPRSEEKEI